MKSFRSLLLAGMAALAIVLAVPGVALALSGSDFQTGRIIDDGIFFNSNSLNAQQIQTFLNAKVPTCDTNGTQNSTHMNGNRYYTRAEWGALSGNPAPFVCLKDYTENISGRSADTYCTGSVSSGNKTAAQIIYDVSQACAISPMTLIVLLQKEQSLVTDDWPWSVQYRSATGFGCPDSGSCDSTYYGFFNQVYSAARQFQRYSKQSSLYNNRAGQTSNVLYKPNSDCGSTAVYMQTQATAGLYNYTPYQPNAAALNNLYGSGDSCSSYGNRNFWRLFRDWFGPTQGTYSIAITRHPDGTLVRNIGEPEVYLILGDTRYHIPDFDTFNSYGYSWSDVRIATPGDRLLPIGGSLAFRGGTLVRGDGAPEVYTLRCMPTFCVKDHISSIDVFKGLGMNFSEVMVVPQSKVSGMLLDKTISSSDVHLQDSLVLDGSTGKVYLIDTGTKRWVPSLEIFAANRYQWSRVRTATPADLALTNGGDVGFPEGTLLQGSGQPSVYVVDQTDTGIYEKRHIASADVFAGLAYGFNSVFVIDPALLPSLDGTDITD